MKYRRALIQVTRYTICALLFIYLFEKMDGPDLRKALAAALTRWPDLLIGTAFSFCGLFAGVIRWHRLLHGYTIPLPFKKVFKILFIGQFFNAFMPGSCGGDVVRAFYVTRESKKGHRAEAATTVIADRLIGLLTLMLWCSAVIVWRLKFFLNHPQTKIPGLLMLLFLAAALCTSLIFFRIHIFKKWRLFRHLENTLRIGPIIRRAYETLYTLREKPALLCQAVFYSLVNMVFLTLACLYFGKAVGMQVATRDYFTFFPIITVLASVPLTPGALGIREGLFEQMFSVVGAAASKSILASLLVYFGGVICSLFGGIIFMLHTASAGSTLKEEWARLKTESIRKNDSSTDKLSENQQAKG